METFPALLTLFEGNPPLTDGFPSQRPVRRSFDGYVVLRLNKRANNRDADYFIRHHAHYDVTVIDQVILDNILVAFNTFISS